MREGASSTGLIFIVLLIVFGPYLWILWDHARDKPEGKRLGSFVRGLAVLILLFGTPMCAATSLEESRGGLGALVAFVLVMWTGVHLMEKLSD